MIKNKELANKLGYQIGDKIKFTKLVQNVMEKFNDCYKQIIENIIINKYSPVKLSINKIRLINNSYIQYYNLLDAILEINRTNDHSLYVNNYLFKIENPLFNLYHSTSDLASLLRSYNCITKEHIKMKFIKLIKIYNTIQYKNSYLIRCINETLQKIVNKYIIPLSDNDNINMIYSGDCCKIMSTDFDSYINKIAEEILSTLIVEKTLWSMEYKLEFNKLNPNKSLLELRNAEQKLDIILTKPINDLEPKRNFLKHKNSEYNQEYLKISKNLRNLLKKEIHNY